MQRWLKLPDGRYIDANSIVYVGKVETYPRLDDDGNEAGQARLRCDGPTGLLDLRQSLRAPGRAT